MNDSTKQSDRRPHFSVPSTWSAAQRPTILPVSTTTYPHRPSVLVLLPGGGGGSHLPSLRDGAWGALSCLRLAFRRRPPQLPLSCCGVMGCSLEPGTSFLAPDHCLILPSFLFPHRPLFVVASRYPTTHVVVSGPSLIACYRGHAMTCHLILPNCLPCCLSRSLSLPASSI